MSRMPSPRDEVEFEVVAKLTVLLVGFLTATAILAGWKLVEIFCWIAS